MRIIKLSDRLKFAITNDLSEEAAKQIVTETIGTDPTLEELNRFFGRSIRISENRLTSATYYACMQIRCNSIAKLPLHLLRWNTKGGAERVYNHPLSKLLGSRPNPYTNIHDFLWATEFSRLHTGNAFWVADRQKGIAKALYLLDSSRMEVLVDNTGLLGTVKNKVYYLYADPLQGALPYSSDEIVHFKNFALDGIRGTSISRYLYETIANEQYAGQVLSEKYKTGLQDPLVVQYVGDLNDARQQQIQKKFASLGGSKNAGKVLPIPTEFKVSQLETKLVNSQFFELQGLTSRHIANGFGVKGYQLNDMEKSTYHNVEQQNKAYYVDTLQNALTTYEQEIDYKLLTTDEVARGYLYHKFNVDSILRSDYLQRMQAYSAAVRSAILMPSEARAKEDLPFVAGSDKLIWGNGASVPLEDLGKQYEKG